MYNMMRCKFRPGILAAGSIAKISNRFRCYYCDMCRRICTDTVWYLPIVAHTATAEAWTIGNLQERFVVVVVVVMHGCDSEPTAGPKHRWGSESLSLSLSFSLWLYICWSVHVSISLCVCLLSIFMKTEVVKKGVNIDNFLYDFIAISIRFHYDFFDVLFLRGQNLFSFFFFLFWFFL